MAFDDLSTTQRFSRERWARFHNLHLIANLAAQFIVGFDLVAGMHHFPVQRVPVGAGDFHHHRFHHLVAGHNTS